MSTYPTTAEQVEHATPPDGRRSCSSTASGCCRAAGTAGPRLFEDAGYATLTPGWPDDPDTVEEANATPRGVRPQDRRPGRRPLRRGDRRARPASRPSSATPSAGCSRRSSPAAASRPRRSRSTRRPFRGVLPLPISALKSASPVLGNPANRTAPSRSPTTSSATPSPTRSSEDEAKELYETYAVPAAGAPLFQAAAANLNPWTEAKVNTKNPDRGPLLIISGEKDHTVPWAIANASFKRQRATTA